MKKTIFLLALFSVLVTLTSCSKPEEMTISKYFQAMQHDDKDTLGSMAIEPKFFKFKSYKIANIEEAVVKELELPAYEKQLKDLEDQKKKQFDLALEKNDAVEDLKFELDETRSRGQKAEIEKKLAEMGNAAKEEKDKYLAINAQVNQMKKKIEAEKTMITTSTGIAKDLEIFTGETYVTRATIKVTLVDNQEKDYIFILRKNVLKIEGRTTDGRFVIIKIGTPEEIAQEEKQG